jgi:serine/threonine-protein kinase HipA
MRLAHRAKLSVAEVALLRVPEPVLAVKRFDRERSGGRVVRRHIIDGCQALRGDGTAQVAEAAWLSFLRP